MSDNKFYGQPCQDEKIIEDINKRNLSTIKNKCSPSYIVVSKETYIYLKKNFNNKFNF